MRVILPGGSGQVGGVLARHFHAAGHEVIVLSRVGDGRQYVSWIHERDFIRAVEWLIERHDLSGPVNLASPNPLPYAEFMRGLRRGWGSVGGKWGAKVGLPATKWMIEIGTRLMRTESELVLKSRRVVPGRLLDSGFRFEFPDWPEAAAELCRRWRSSHQGLTC